MAVRAEDKHARRNVLLQHHLVTDALSFIEINAVLLREIPHLLLGRRRLRAVAGHIVVHNPDQLLHILDVGILQLIVLIHRQMGGSVIAHEVIQLHRVDLSGVHLRKACRPGDNLFRNGHSHVYSSYLSKDAMSPPWSRMFCRCSGSFVQA